MKDAQDNDSFYNAALVGAGTINEDGTYGPPEPDPTLKRGGVQDGRTTSGGVKRQPPAEVADADEQKRTSRRASEPKK